MAHPPPTSSPRWPAWTVPAALGVGVVTAFAGQALILIVLELVGLHVDLAHPGPGINVALTAVLDVSLVGSVWVLAAVVVGPRPTLDQLGLRRVSLRRAVGPALVVAVAYFALAAVYALLVSAPKERVPGIGATSPTASVLAFGLLVGVIAPVAEELFFRGFAFTALRGRLGTAGAAVASGVLFGVMHLGGRTDAVFVPALALFGVGLALLYARTGSLLPGIALHSLNNAFALSVLVGWSWQAVPLALGFWLLLAAGLGLLTRPGSTEAAGGQPD